MSVITKKVGDNSYAYLVNREGEKVSHRYLGSIHDSRVKEMISAYQEVSTVPGRFRSLFWDTNLKNVHIKRNSRYIIERILEMGSLDAVTWMQRAYTVRHILDVLATSRSLGKKSIHFWEVWFGVKDA